MAKVTSNTVFAEFNNNFVGVCLLVHSKAVFDLPEKLASSSRKHSALYTSS